MSGLRPENRELSDALRQIISKETWYGDRAQRVLVVSQTGEGYEVRARLSPKQVREGTHLSRVREMREDEQGVEAIIHINLRGTASCAFVYVLEEGDRLYRLRPQKPPKPLRWVAVTDRQRERWDEVWNKL